MIVEDAMYRERRAAPDTRRGEDPDPMMKRGDHPGFHASPRSMMMIAHIVNFVYGSSFFMQASVFTYLCRKLGADTETYGWIQTLFATLQLIGNPIFGYFGDVFGPKVTVIVALTSAGLSHMLLGFSTNLTMLVISRFPAIAMHGYTACQMLVTSVNERNKRAEALGQLGVSFGVGMIVGPLIGGWLTESYGEELAALMAGAGNLLILPFVLMVIPWKMKPMGSHHADTIKSEGSVQKMIRFFSTPGVIFLFLVRLCSAVPIGIFQSTFSVFAMDTFRLSPEQGGYFMSFIGITIMVAQGVGVRFVARIFSESTVLISSSFFLIWSYLGLAYTTKVWQLYLVCMPLVLNLTILNIIVTSALTHTVSSDSTGAVLGLNMAIYSFVRAVSPTLGGYMLNAFGYPSIGNFGFTVSFVTTLVLCIGYGKKPWAIYAKFKQLFFIVNK
ncbi:solute carrier family 22 member 18-like isoform X2 [Pomacea canaliculata]|uniref:solute carrier family 22 member 18-like isoform X2 n=1 Tax=Pomacea canaliculata TaxID=400727 RepID=UPI000D72F2CC|nr:solute carrier family 22 member 18-like isoform X2 [Pomacea canaliculata]